MGKCYIVQEVLRKDSDTGELVPVLNLSRVAEYGEPVVCLRTGRVSLTPGPTIDKLTEILRHYDPDEDYIVPVGDPSAMFIAAMVAGSMTNGRCRILKWDRVAKRYIPIEIDLYYRKRKERMG